MIGVLKDKNKKYKFLINNLVQLTTGHYRACHVFSGRQSEVRPLIRRVPPAG